MGYETKGGLWNFMGAKTTDIGLLAGGRRAQKYPVTRPVKSR